MRVVKSSMTEMLKEKYISEGNPKPIKINMWDSLTKEDEQDVKIEWEAIANIFDIFDEVGAYEDGIFNKYPTDIIIAKIFKKDRFLFKMFDT